METICISYIITMLLTLLIVVLGVIIFAENSSIFDKVLSIIGVVFFIGAIVIILKISSTIIMKQGIEEYLDNKIVKTIDYIKYTENNIPKDTVYTYKHIK